MRTGGCTIQQTLTVEAASVLKHSLNLARRRGHAQVTPLHVAATLLASRSSLLRRACIKSHPGFSPNYQLAPSHHPHHPLHCRALELCFNVALNRLPTIPGPMFHGQPSLANALIAALKRAQAHQRRGCIEQQQQQQQQQPPLMTIKVELDRLVVSILDDPSVSRVMREAGFSSTAVKNCIEDCSVSTVFYGSSVGVFSSPCSPSSNDHHQHFHHHHQNIVKDFHQPLLNPSTFWQTHFLPHTPEQNPLLISPHKKLFANTDYSFHSLKEDVKLVFDVLLRKKKNPVIVGDSVSVTEGLVSELMAKIERREVDQGDLKQTRFIRFQFSPMALKFMRREDVETNISELRKKVVSLTSCGKGAIIYTGDLKWTVGENNNNGGGPVSSSSSSSSYSPLDHIVEEVGRLVSEYNNNNNDKDNNSINTLSKTRVWVMGTASYQTYMRCQMRQPSLETQWSLQAVSVPSGGLGLTLHATSGHDSRASGRSQVVEAKPFGGKGDENVLSCCSECVSNYEREAKALKSSQDKLLPSWLQSHGDNSSQKDDLVGLRRKWNSYCHSLHQGRTAQINQFGPPALHCNQSLMGKTSSGALPYPWWPNQNNGLSDSASISFMGMKPYQRASNSVAKFRRQNSCTTPFHLGNEPKLESLNGIEDKDVETTLDLGRSLFQSASSQEMKQSGVLAMALRENIPWQNENLPSIVEILMDPLAKEKDTWMLIGGNDIAAKQRLACVVSESLFGSLDALVHIRSNKKRVDETKTCSDMLMSSLKKHKKLVVLVEDVDSADAHFLKLLADRFEENQSFGAKNRGNGQVIFILTKEDSWSNTDEGRKFQDSVVQMTLKITENNLDHKRKPESDLPKGTKIPRTEEKENESVIRKDFSRQSSFNSTLDLNLKAEEGDEEEEAKGGEISPISSDLTLDISSDMHISSNGFLNMIENWFVFDRDLNTDKVMKNKLVEKIKESFGEILGGQNRIRFSVEEKVIEELWGGSGYFVNGTFENWLREVFQTGLVTVKKGGKKDTVVIRLGFGGIVDKLHGGGGFMGTCLPNEVQVSNIE